MPNTPILTVNLPNPDVSFMPLQKEDSAAMPITSTDQEILGGPVPLYQNLENPLIPMRRSVHRKRSSKHAGRASALPHAIYRVGVGEELTIASACRENKQINEIKNVTMSERPNNENKANFDMEQPKNMI